MSRRNQNGQAVLIVLLSLSVVLIIVLYIMSRSVTDLSLSSKEENSLRAFSAAEAGIERSLMTLLNSSGPIGGAEFTADVIAYGQGQDSIVYPSSLKSGEIATFWFADQNGLNVFDGNLMKFCWGNVDTPINNYSPAIELVVYYGPITDLNIVRATLDPFNSRPDNNNFDLANSNPTCTIGSENFEFWGNINLSSLGLSDLDRDNLVYVNARILYNTTISHKIGIDVSGNGILPSQGNKVVSSGSFSEANRKIEVYETYKVTPPIFENSLFSANGIVK